MSAFVWSNGIGRKVNSGFTCLFLVVDVMIYIQEIIYRDEKLLQRYHWNVVMALKKMEQKLG